MGVKKLGGAVLLPELRKGALGGGLLGVLGVTVAREEALRNVQRPLLRLPPWPRLARRTVRRLALLQPRQTPLYEYQVQLGVIAGSLIMTQILKGNFVPSRARRRLSTCEDPTTQMLEAPFWNKQLLLLIL